MNIDSIWISPPIQGAGGVDGGPSPIQISSILVKTSDDRYFRTHIPFLNTPERVQLAEGFAKAFKKLMEDVCTAPESSNRT